MFNNILIIGCGLIGSSILRATISKKIAKKFFVFEKSKKHIAQIKNINSRVKVINKLDQRIKEMDMVVLSTPMSEYEKIIPKLNKHLKSKCLIFRRM